MYLILISYLTSSTSSASSIRDSLELLAKNWSIDPQIYDLQLGNRKDVYDTTLTVDKVTYHIPTLATDKLFVLWRCLWPDCHNCCDRQGRLPLTIDDVHVITRKMGYRLESDFLKNETKISSWDEKDEKGRPSTLFTMLSLKRKEDESDREDGTPIRCRFLSKEGNCGLQPEKPGVCWLYPFASWINIENNVPVVHATFQFTGDCPGFYLSDSLDQMTPVLNEYAKTIYNYNMAIRRTIRNNYGLINFVT
jgi:uncharacterized protein